MANAQYAILRFAKYKGPEISGIEAHNERTKEKYASNPDIDPSRTHLNFHLIKPERKYRAESECQIAEAGCRTRSDSVRVVEALITATPEFFKGKKRAEIREFFNEALEFIKQNQAPETIISAVVHLDEKSPHKKQIHEELLETAVAEVITKLVSNPKFAALMQQKISMKVDTSAIEQEIANYEKQLRQSYSIKSRLIEEIDTLDPDDKHYIKRKADLDDRLYKMYDKIEDTESLLIEARAKKMAIEAEKLTADNIYKVLIYFDKLYAVMDEQERRQLMESLISEIHIFEERKPNGQWLKSIKFKLPIIEEDMEISLDNDTQVETVILLTRE